MIISVVDKFVNYVVFGYFAWLYNIFILYLLFIIIIYAWLFSHIFIAIH